MTLSQPYLLVNSGVDPVAVAMKPGDYLGGNSGNEPLPNFNAKHPNNPRLILDSYSINSGGADKKITALYSTDRRFRFPTANVVPVTGYRWRTSFESQRPEIPWTAKVKQLLATPVLGPGQTGPPDPPVFKDVWLFLNQAMIEKVMRISIECRIKADALGSAIETIFDQAGNIHKINNRYYMFEPSEIGDADSTTDDYRASLSWVRSSGIVNIDINTLPLDGSVQFPQVFSKLPNEPQTPWTKPPLHDVILRPQPGGDPSALPEFISVLSKKYDPNGYAAILALLP